MRFIWVLIFVSTAHAEEWTKTDYALLGGAMTLLVVDWGQTRDLVRRPYCVRNIPSCQTNYYERNNLIGEDPSIGNVDKYFTVAILGTIGLAYLLPQTYRRYFLGGVIVLEGFWVGRNHHIGLRAEF